jgi:hypothetical protein
MTARVAGLLLAALLMAGPQACSKPLTVEQQIIAMIREMEARIENGERRPFMSHVAEDFDGQNGLLNRDELQRFVILQLNQHQRLHAQLMPIRVSETGDDTASASFRALITGGPNWIPDSGQIYDFETGWIKLDGEWLLLSATWTPTPLEKALY